MNEYEKLGHAVANLAIAKLKLKKAMKYAIDNYAVKGDTMSEYAIESKVRKTNEYRSLEAAIRTQQSIKIKSLNKCKKLSKENLELIVGDADNQLNLID